MDDDQKAWESKENPRDNFATFDNRDIQDGNPDDSKGILRLFAIRKRFILLFFALIGCTFLLGYLWPEKYPYFTLPAAQSVIEKYLPPRAGGFGDDKYARQKTPVVEEDKGVQEPVHREYSKADVEQAKREVLLKRRVEWNKQQVIEKVEREAPAVAIEEEEAVPPRYEYQIELVSGGRIFTDNAVMTDESVSFEDSGGLWVSIDRNEVKKITRIRIAAENP